jgi:1-phosphofructokinase family hexose kinase
MAQIGRDVAERVRCELDELGVRSRLIEHSDPTRVCTTLLDSATGTVTELIENARPLSAECLDSFAEGFVDEVRAADIVVLSGSLPAGAPAAFYRDLLQHVRGRVVLDARGPELVAALECRPFLVKPNREELANTLDRSLDDDEALVTALREINQLGAEWVVVSEGKQGLWASSREGVWRFEALPVAEVVNPIGCGDCLAAGIAWALSRGREPLECIRIGTAAAAQNAAQLLPGRLSVAQAIEQSRLVQVELYV